MSSCPDTDAVTLNTLDKKLDKILDQISVINSRLDRVEAKQIEHEKSIEFLFNDLDDTKKKLVNTASEGNPPSQPIENLLKRLEMNEHASRAKCIELNGIPFGKGENLFEGLEKLAKALKYSWLNITTGIDTVFRVRKTNKVIVKFTQTGKRDMFFQQYRREITTARTLGFDVDQKIYINEVLSEDQGKLFWKTREFKKTNNFRYVWTFNQRIYLRKNTESDAVQISSESDLAKLEEAC